jgi:catechol 1,2-dioxygenase
VVNQRVIEVFGDLEHTLLDFIRKHRITPDEYRLVTDLIVDSIRSGEESMLFDVFFQAEAQDVVSRQRSGSAMGIEGPFYFEGAPRLDSPYVLPQRPDEPGDPLVFRGTARSTSGVTLGGAVVDMWQADADAKYSNVHPDVPKWNLRGCFASEPDGTFEVRTIVPPPYEIPGGGPTGSVLRALGRHCFRPAHLHVKVSAPGHETLTSQLYFRGDQYLDSDAANAVRDGLVVSLDRAQDGYLATYDFVVEPIRMPTSA